MKTELEGSLDRPKGGDWMVALTGGHRVTSRPFLLTSMAGYARALLRLRTAHRLCPVYHALIFKIG